MLPYGCVLNKLELYKKILFHRLSQLQLPDKDPNGIIYTIDMKVCFFDLLCTPVTREKSRQPHLPAECQEKVFAHASNVKITENLQYHNINLKVGHKIVTQSN